VWFAAAPWEAVGRQVGPSMRQGHRPVAAWTLEAVAAYPLRHRPWRLVDQHMVDLPRRLTRSAEQEGEVVLAADREQHSRLDLDGTGAATDIAGVPDVGAAKSCRRETAAAEMLCHGPMLVAAWTAGVQTAITALQARL
jgi:hypothetical protein